MEANALAADEVAVDQQPWAERPDLAMLHSGELYAGDVECWMGRRSSRVT